MPYVSKLDSAPESLGAPSNPSPRTQPRISVLFPAYTSCLPCRMCHPAATATKTQTGRPNNEPSRLRLRPCNRQTLSTQKQFSHPLYISQEGKPRRHLHRQEQHPRGCTKRCPKHGDPREGKAKKEEATSARSRMKGQKRVSGERQCLPKRKKRSRGQGKTKRRESRDRGGGRMLKTREAKEMR